MILRDFAGDPGVLGATPRSRDDPKMKDPVGAPSSRDDLN
jgi:hypothetical protein